MSLGAGTANLISFLVHFVADIIAVTTIAYFIYFRRHSRRDLLMAYTTFNIGLFLVMTVMSIDKPVFGVGFGLFGILSIIRIRSEEFTNTELSYAFVVLVVGVINAFGVGETAPTMVDGILLLILNATAIFAVYLMDHPRLLRRVGRQLITLDKIHPNDQSLRADLEQRLGVQVLDYSIANVDYVREITVLDVRYATAV